MVINVWDDYMSGRRFNCLMHVTVISDTALLKNTSSYGAYTKYSSLCQFNFGSKTYFYVYSNLHCVLTFRLTKVHS